MLYTNRKHLFSKEDRLIIIFQRELRETVYLYDKNVRFPINGSCKSSWDENECGPSILSNFSAAINVSWSGWKHFAP